MCFVFRLFLGTLASSSAPLLSPNSVHWMTRSALGMSRIIFNYVTISLRGKTSLVAVDNAMYSAYVVDNVISVWRRLNHVMGQPAYLITHPVLDLTELGSSQVSLV